MYDKEIEEVLDQYVRPLLATHGGGMEVLDFDEEEGILHFKMTGHCAGCSAADLTSEELINGELLEHCTKVKKAVLVNEVSQDLIDQARAIMRRRHGE